MGNVILRVIGAIAFSLTITTAFGASTIEAGLMAGSLYLLFSTADNK